MSHKTVTSQVLKGEDHVIAAILRHVVYPSVTSPNKAQLFPLMCFFVGIGKEKAINSLMHTESSPLCAASRARQKVSVRVIEEVLFSSSCSQQHKNEEDVSPHTRAIHY